MKLLGMLAATSNVQKGKVNGKTTYAHFLNGKSKNREGQYLKYRSVIHART